MAELEQVHRGDPARPALIFIHGLEGDRFDTWVGTGTSRDDCWPHWAGQDNGCDSWVLAYDAAFSAWRAQAMPLERQAGQVADLLATRSELAARPLVLIGHSLGGLVIKALVVQAMTQGEGRMESLARRILGVIFVATPHHGSNLANLATALGGLLRINPQLGDLAAHESHLQTLNAQFRHYSVQLGIAVRTFSEQRAVTWSIDVWGGLRVRTVSVLVVDSTSSDPGLPGQVPVPLAEDHFSICKPERRDAQIHKSACDFIRTLPPFTHAVPALAESAASKRTPILPAVGVADLSHPNPPTPPSPSDEAHSLRHARPTDAVGRSPAGKRIFMSYRRGDAAGSARALFRELQRKFGADEIFFDQDELRPGGHFPSRLVQAIDQAQVVLVVMGNTWLPELHHRMGREAGEPDFVRAEVKLALELQQKHPDTRSIVPVLMECEQMPERHLVNAELWRDIGGLWDYTACVLSGEQQRWNRSMNGLLLSLASMLDQRHQASPVDFEQVKSTRDVVRALLARDGMKPLRDRWGPDPLAGMTADEVQSKLTSFGGHVKVVVEEIWAKAPLEPAFCEDVKRACRGVVAALYELAVDIDTARTWVEAPDPLRPVPAESAGVAAVSYALVHGLNTVMPETNSRIDSFVPKNVVDLGLPDSGTTEARRATVQRRLWQSTFVDPVRDYPSGEGPLSAEHLNTLKDWMWANAEQDRYAHIVTEVQAIEGAQTDLQVIADELGMVALPRTGQDAGLLRVSERRFNVLVLSVLARIDRIPSK